MKNIVLKKFFLLLLVTFCFVNLNATHNRAGEITYVQLSDLTYEITITTFTYTLSFADRPALDVEWGDNTTSTAQRISKLSLPNFYQRNIYKIIHTYPGPGGYRIVVQDPNRNAGVKNIPNSVNVVFSMSTTVIVDRYLGRNSTPVLLNPPYDKAALGYVFIHNPAAYDPDGDSLSYALTVCTREDGKPIENYTFPPAFIPDIDNITGEMSWPNPPDTGTFKVDPISGDLIWDTPSETGTFNVAIEIYEWRNGRKIGAVERDMQIEVYKTYNKPPVNGPLTDYCVEAGDTVDFLFSATDKNQDSLSLKAISGVFNLTSCPAQFIKTESVPGNASSRFRWIPCHETVRNQPYDVIFKSEDNNAEVSLFDIDHMKITVLGPSPVILNAIPVGKTILLTWSDYDTSAVTGFSIYRREGASAFKPDSCTPGIPSSTGFVKLGYIDGNSTTSYSDALGLKSLKEYTYRIVAVYRNKTESKASNEKTSKLISGLPVIKNVSVRNTDAVNGSIYLSWKKPDKLDTIPANGPYKYLIFRADGVGGANFLQIDSILTVDLNDTIFIDTLNTQSSGYLYKVELWNNASGNRFLISDPGYASSLFLTVNPDDKDKKAKFLFYLNVPWINSRYDFFRLNETTSTYDSIGSTNQLTFVDNGLVNGKQYCYYVRSVGGYQADNMPKNLLNLSETVCTTPVDNVPPCAPLANVASQCDNLYNTISWTISDPGCSEDVAGFNIYYDMNTDENLTLLNTIDDKNIFSYNHYPGDIVKGCYAVSAFDSNGNESVKSVIVCIDSCNVYQIPNVFTPNGDNKNDKLVAKTFPLVEKVDFRLFNRNGLLLFRTEEPKIDWDGTYKGKIVSPGVYFYQCDKYERRISGLELFHLSGFVHVITEENAKLNNVETK
ncbi:MAG: gliding motility-associated C-terminal domain-containing protein [Bacteroidia bacterium]|nr:gliding motility-associated C-terminal domain-containing protein [Bacteroidia bacterium]